jgi:hypothetical protein
MFANNLFAGRIDPDLSVARLQQALDLPGLTEMAEPKCQGISRFFDCADDSTNLVLTCLWLPSLVVVECVSAWSVLPADQHGDRLRSIRWVSRIPVFFLPRRIHGWERLNESLAAAPSCQGDLIPGSTLAFHSLLAGGSIANVVWSNPHPRRQRPQTTCIAAYRWLARIGRMCSLFPLQGKEDERVRSLTWTASLPLRADFGNCSFTGILPGSTV